MSENPLSPEHPRRQVLKQDRMTAIVRPGRTVTMVGEKLTLDLFIETLEELLGKARRARSLGIELKTFMSMLKDQSRSP